VKITSSSVYFVFNFPFSINTTFAITNKINWRNIKMDENKNTEEFKISGEDLIAKIKEIVKQGNAKKITIKGKDGNEIISFPVTIGVAGLVLAPVFAAVGAIAALATECTIIIEK